MKKIALVLLFMSSSAYAQAPPPWDLPTVNGSVAIATGNTFQQVLAVVPTGSAARRSLTIQNNNTNGDSCWVFFGAAASATKATSIILVAGGSYSRFYPFVPSDIVSATCTTNADTLYVETQ